jgi:hypothetical protein
MKRRDFLKSSLPAAAAVHAGLRGEPLPAAMEEVGAESILPA